MRERITVERPGWPVLAVELTEVSGAIATLTATVAHNWQSGDYIDVAGLGVVQVTATGPMTAEFPIDGDVTEGATTAVFVKDAQGSVRDSWVVFAVMAAAVMPLSAQERLAQPPALMTQRFTRFKVWNVAGLLESMRVRWTPTHPPEAAERVMQIQGVVEPDSGDRRFLMLECVGA